MCKKNPFVNEIYFVYIIAFPCYLTTQNKLIDILCEYIILKGKVGDPLKEI